MSKYIIHACPERMWYVEKYLVPSMKEQGIEDIDIRCDDNHIGNLQSCMKIFESMPDDDGGAWHLQDDIIICKDFKERTEKYQNSDDIICGYVRMDGNHTDKIGYVPFKNMWWSFPCIYIPNKYARECAYWFFNESKWYVKYRKLMKTRKNDDMFFMEYLKIKDNDMNTNLKILNLKPNLVDHIDYLIGGTIVNKDRNNMNVRARYFDDQDLVKDLEDKINTERINS